MANEKKIRFTAVDSGVSSFINKAQQQAKELYSNINEEARKLGLRDKERVSYLQEQVREFDRLAKIQRTLREQELNSKFSSLIQGAKNPTQRSIYEKQFEKAKERLASESSSDTQISALLKELVEETKRQNRETQRRIKREEEYRKVHESLWQQELLEDEKGVRSRIRGAKAGFFGRLAGKQDYEGLDSYTAEKLSWQEKQLQQKQPQESLFKSLLKLEAVKWGAGVIRSGANKVASTASIQNEDEPIGELYGALPSAVPLIGDAAGRILAQGKDRELREKERQQTAQLRLSALTGTRGFSAHKYGMSFADATEFAQQVARSQGGASNLKTTTRNILGLQYGYGVDQGTLMQSLSMGRMTNRGGDRAVADLIAKGVQEGLFKNGDFSRLGEFVETQNSLVQQLSQTTGVVNAGAVTGVISNMSQLGGAFGDQRLSQRLSQINQALVSPQGEFMKAQSFAALSQINPQGSYFDILKMKEKGITQKGYLKNMLSTAQQMYGGGDAMKLGVMNMLGLNASDAEKLVEGYLKNPEMFEGGGKIPGDIQKVLKGRAGAGKYERQRAELEDEFAKGFFDGVRKSMKMAFGKFFEEVQQDLMDILGDESAYQESVNKVKREQKRRNRDRSNETVR